MSATTVRPRRAALWPLDDDGRQLVAVLLVIAVGLAAGFVTKTIAESQTRAIRAGSVSAAIPQGWIYQPGAGDVVFSATDPRVPGQRYVVSLLKNAAGQALGPLIDARTSARAQLLPAFQQVSRSSTTVAGRSGEAVTYGYAVVRTDHAPRSMQARDVYLPGPGGILVITLESPADLFDDALGPFGRFAASVGS